MGNEETKELICMTSGHSLRWVNADGRGGIGQRGIQRRKKWDNCDSVISKIYFYKMKNTLEEWISNLEDKLVEIKQSEQ